MGRKIVLTRAKHVRAELSRIYCEAREGKIPIGDASRLGNLLSIIARVVESADTEERVAKIERFIKERESEL